MREYVYVLSSSIYAKKDIFKIGRTNNLIKRLASLNTGRISIDTLYIVHFRECTNAKWIEREIHRRLYRCNIGKEFFKSPLHYIKLIVSSTVSKLMKQGLAARKTSTTQANPINSSHSLNSKKNATIHTKTTISSSSDSLSSNTTAYAQVRNAKKRSKPHTVVIQQTPRPVMTRQAARLKQCNG